MTLFFSCRNLQRRSALLLVCSPVFLHASPNKPCLPARLPACLRACLPACLVFSSPLPSGHHNSGCTCSRTHCLFTLPATPQQKYNMVSNCTALDVILEKYFLPPSYAIEFSIGFPGNLLVVLGYIFCLQEWQSCNIYLFNLAISDLIFLCTLPRLSYLYANGQSETRAAACVINRYILHVNLYSSILFMVLLSMDRFLLIRHPTRNHYLLRPRNALIVTGLSWLAVNVQIAPMIALMIDDLYSANWTRCKDYASLRGKVDSFSYSLGLTMTGYILPLLGLCVFSCKIAQLLRAQERALQRKTTSFKRPLRVVASAAAMFLVLYTPYHVLRNIRIASEQPWAGVPKCTQTYIEGMYIVSRPLAFVHSVINPVFYFLMGDKFRELLLTKVRKLARKTEQQRPSALQNSTQDP